jgi:transcription elongation regulator 1
MLKENAIVEHWGRLKKEEKREKVALIGQEGTRNDESDDEDGPGMADMADQVDLKAIHTVLRVRFPLFRLLPSLFAHCSVHSLFLFPSLSSLSDTDLVLPASQQDKRYLEFDHLPEEREKWIEEYVENLSAPKQTMHQRDWA